MLSAFKPPIEKISEFRAQQQDAQLAYTEQRATLGKKSKEDFGPEFEAAGYDIDHHRVKLGEGEQCWVSAVKALQSWRMFHMKWVELYDKDTPPTEGIDVVIVAKNLGFWSLSACRVVYTVNELEEDGELQRCGFAYGTLPTHLEKGESRFLIEWNHKDNSVYYDLLSFSKPQHWLVSMGYPVARLYQTRFAEDSKKAMCEAVEISI